MVREARPIRVLVVDDSSYNRRHIEEAFQRQPEVEVVGRAADGEEALKLALTLRPDVITLDLEMPRMDGFTFLRILMARQPTPTIVFSSYAQRENVFKALELGALDFVPKPDRVGPESADVLEQLLQKVLLVRSLRSNYVPASVLGKGNSASSGRMPLSARHRPPIRFVAFAASTGGPSALMHIFSRLTPRGHTAYFVTQHMPDKFTRAFADRLGKKSNIRVEEAVDGSLISADVAYICPGSQCMEIASGPGGHTLRVMAPKPDDLFVPSANRLFRSMTSLRSAATAVVLTGMGDDGASGGMLLRQAGARVVAESEETAVVYGMPGALVRVGAATDVLSLSQIGELFSA